MEKNKPLPECAFNPMYNILTFEWFMYVLRNIITKGNLNIYIVHNNNYKQERKKYGKFKAAFHKKTLVSAIKSIKGVIAVGDLESPRVIILSDKNLILEIEELMKNNKFNLTIGATASILKDNEFSVINRALKALELAHIKKDNFQII